MPHFTDKAGRRWTIALNIAVVRRVREKLDVDLLDKELPKLLERVFGDTVLLCDVLYVVANENAAANERVDSEAFGRELHGDCIEEGANALLDAIRDFFPNPRDRARAGKLVATVRAETERAHDQADKVLDAALERMKNGRTGPVSSTSPPSRASSRGRTRSAS